MAALVDLTGQVFGRLRVLVLHPERSRSGQVMWECVCTCGTRTIIRAGTLKNGHTQSCGCLMREINHHRFLRHGCRRPPDGRRPTPEYSAWQAIRTRCTNPKQIGWKYYGGRGITVCERWLGDNGFLNFLADMGEKPEPKHLYSIDRIDPNGNYEPGNCRWATAKEQANNQRCRSKKAA